MNTYYELTPAYGKDYKSAAEVINAWRDGADFVGDYQLGFQYVNQENIPKPSTVNLRYARERRVAVVKVAR
jgi:hypothetical protein